MGHMTQEVHSDTLYQTLIVSQAITSNTTTVATSFIDKELTENYAQEFMMSSTTVTDGTFTMQIQDSPDGTTWTPVDPQFLVGPTVVFTAADDNLNRSQGYVGHQEFVRTAIISTGVTTGGTFSSTVLLQIHRHQPVGAQA